MPFSRANIDRAIVMTQYDLRGFAHPLGFRSDSHKCFSAIPGNLVSFAIGNGKPDGDLDQDPNYVSFWESSYEDYLMMYKQFAANCECVSQKEAVQLIIKDIVQKSRERKASVAAGETEPSAYLKPLKKDNWWGKSVLALAEAFEVTIETEPTPQMV